MALEWECLDCGYLYEGKTPPHRCPDCDAIGAWESVQSGEEWDEDEAEEEQEEKGTGKVEAEWECMDCGYLHEGKQPPRRCPDCGAVGAWERVEYVDDSDDDFDDEDE